MEILTTTATIVGSAAAVGSFVITVFFLYHEKQNPDEEKTPQSDAE